MTLPASVPVERKKRLVVAITGASGAPYALRFLDLAEPHCSEIYCLITEQAFQVISIEAERPVNRQSVSAQTLLSRASDVLRFPEPRDYFSPPASGSFRHDGMVIVPCSMGTAGRIANGISDDLITRSADVCLKERRPLVIVPRETPWNLIQLRNMTQLTEAGAVVLPAAPGFYFQPKTIADLVDHLVARILQQVGISTPSMPQWQHREDEE